MRVCGTCKHRGECIHAFSGYNSIGNDDHMIDCSFYETILYNSDPECEHEIVNASGGGIKCKKCNG